MTNSFSPSPRSLLRPGWLRAQFQFLFRHGPLSGWACLALTAPAAAPQLTVAIQGSVENLRYQKSQSSATQASVQDQRQQEILGNGAIAGRTTSAATASAGFGHLHLSLTTSSEAKFVWNTFWGSSGQASGNAGEIDWFSVQLPGVPSGSVVPVAVTLGVDASITTLSAAGDLEASLIIRRNDENLVEIRYNNTSNQLEPSRGILDRQGPSLRSIEGEETAVLQLKTGVIYQIDAPLQGSSSAASDINPGTVLEAQIPTSNSRVDAGNTAHIGINPLAPGATIVSQSGTNYAMTGIGPTLLSSPQLSGPYLPVSGAQLDLDQRQITAPVADGNRFYRLSARWSRPIVGATLSGGRLVFQY